MDFFKELTDIKIPTLKKERKSQIHSKIGESPGSIIYVGKERQGKAKIDVIDYTEKTVNETTVKTIEEVFKYKEKKSITWINITGIHDTETIKRVGEHFELHPLLLEDVVNTRQRPKLEEFEKSIFQVLKMVYYDEETRKIAAEQISIILTKGVVISFQETEKDVFGPIRKRIQANRKRLLNPDYLNYALLDLIIDNYFVAMETFGDHISKIEEDVIKDQSAKVLDEIYELKREILFLRKNILPVREVVNELQKSESKLTTHETKLYLKDAYDHQIQVIEAIETYRDMVTGLQELYISISGNKMNEIMKVLTIIATIFIPLTFIAGIYGMNFAHMPELQVSYAYPLVWALMLLVAAAMLLFFRLRKWI